VKDVSITVLIIFVFFLYVELTGIVDIILLVLSPYSILVELTTSVSTIFTQFPSVNVLLV
jgi:hypothetical protein